MLYPVTGPESRYYIQIAKTTDPEDKPDENGRRPEYLIGTLNMAEPLNTSCLMEIPLEEFTDGAVIMPFIKHIEKMTKTLGCSLIISEELSASLKQDHGVNYP